MKTKRRKLYEKARNIKNNNLSKQYRGNSVDMKTAPLIINQFNAYQAFIARMKRNGRRFKITN